MSTEETPTNATKKAMSDRERARRLYDKRSAEGWKKTWVAPELLSMARQFGGLRKLGAALEQQGEELTKLRLENLELSQLRDKLTEDLGELSEKHEELAKAHGTLEETHQKLSEDHGQLEERHQELRQTQENTATELDQLKRRGLLSRLLNRSQ